MTYDKDFRPLGIHVLLNRSLDLVAPALGDVLPVLERRRVVLVVEQRPNITSVTSNGLGREIVGNFVTPRIPLTGWMFGTRTGTRTELVQLEHVVLSTLADSCQRAMTSSCAANSIVLPLGAMGTLCVQINTTLPMAVDNMPVQIRYTGHSAWNPYNGTALIKYAAVDSNGAIFALSVVGDRMSWTIERQALCIFIVTLTDTVDSRNTLFKISEGSIPSFVAASGATTTTTTVSASTSTSTSISTSTTNTTVVIPVSTMSDTDTAKIDPNNGNVSDSADLIAPIVGGVVGGVVLLAIVIGIIVFASKRRQRPSSVRPRRSQN